MISFIGPPLDGTTGRGRPPLECGWAGKGRDVDFVRVTTLLATDQAFLERAITLANGGRGRVSPNPLVGAVVVKDGMVLGEGFHARYGDAHAEREALAACGAADTRGATLYVSLEPCCHHGRTPPCTEAILAAGIARVVVASDDPTEKAAGRGLGILRDEGVEVVIAEGEAAAAARLINQPFRKHARTGRPHVRFKAAMTLDGKVATRAGDSKWISGEESRSLAHRWRAESDAVAVGIGTALADDPLLTARVGRVAHQPRRVVFDSEGRLPIDAKLVRGAAEVPLTVVVSRAASRLRTDALEAAGADVVVATGANEPARVRSALTHLGADDITSILLEGGPRLAGAFLDAGEVDELCLFVAPVVVGGASARDPLEGEGVERIAQATRALALDVERIGDDVLLRARLREW
jgi:diaminohydroxyphosphoribosylaminopyrimidine deaminase / 5-amino-6-(5-phosphoribosylamino)uracil reductase